MQKLKVTCKECNWEAVEVYDFVPEMCPVCANLDFDVEIIEGD